MDLIVEAPRFGALLIEAAQWCERMALCLAAPCSEHGTTPAWNALLAASAKLERVIVHHPERSEGWLLHRLHEASALRLIQTESFCPEDQLLRFERGDEVQLFLARAPLAPASLRESCGVVVHYRGAATDAFARSFQRLLEQWREASRVPSGSELDALTAAARSSTGTEPTGFGEVSQLRAITEQRALLESISSLFGLDGSALATAESVAAEGEVLWRVEAGGWHLALASLSDGVRLELSDGGAHSAIEVAIRPASSGAGSSSVLLSDGRGGLFLAWRGGLLGRSTGKQRTLWSQCRLPTAELPPAALGSMTEQAERVALMARSGSAMPAQLTEFAAEVRRLRELLSPRRRVAARPAHDDFLTLSRQDQGELVWSQLIGLGALPLDEAVSTSAQGLREDGYVQYQRLRRDGALYEALARLLRAEGRTGARFDLPAEGYVRAIQPDVTSYAREDWLDCLVSALPEGEVLERTAAMRLVFNYAREVWGLSAQRLRAGGKSEEALKSALNSAIRRGLLRRVGAAYVERITESALERETSTSPAPASPAPAQDSVAHVPADSSEEAAPLPVPAPLALPATEVATVGFFVREPTASAQPSSGASSPPEVRDGLVALLAQSLQGLSLPIRTVNWADRHGLTTLRELVAWHPDAFAKEPNIGRLTLADTRLAVEGALGGREWEDVWAELEEPKIQPPQRADADSETTESTAGLPAPEHSLWNRRLAALSEAQRSLPLTRLPLPSRMRTFCEQRELQTVGALLSIPRDELLAQPNLGRSSLEQTLTTVEETLRELEQPDHEDQLLSAWRKVLQRLPALQRMVLSRRSGSYGPRETLESLGETLGVTRERVRQIEARCLDDIRQRSSLVPALQQRLTAAFAGGRCIPLQLLLEEDPWWRGVETQPEWVDYVFERLLGDTVHRVVLQQRDQTTTFFARFPQQALHDGERELLAQAERVPTPAQLSAYDGVLDDAVARLDPALRETLQIVLEDQLNFDAADPERVLSFGNTKPDRVLALLASQPEPMSVHAVFHALGRCRLPDEVLYFRRGTVGLEQHFPDFRLWQERLVPACLELMAELPPGRQWLVTELHETLRESGIVPDWLGHWHLASLLRRSGQVQYLGRLRIALPGGDNRAERIHLSDAVLSVLQDAGTPLSYQAIAERLRERTDVHDATLSLLLLASPFVKLDGERFGLIERDVSGGSQAIARAVEAVTERLTERQHGLTTHQAHQLATEAAGEPWPPEVVVSLLRSEPQLRLSRSGHVGLSSWDDVRAPTRSELIRQQVEKAGGRLAIAALQATLVELYGRPLERAELSNDCHRSQLQLDGDDIVSPTATESAPTPPAATTDLAADEPAPSSQPPASAATTDLTGRVQGLPAAARQHFEELLRQPLQPRAELLARAREHLAEIESAGRHNEFIELSLARALVERMERLLERVEGLSPITRRIAQAAVLYFISTEDAEDDFDLGGLEDDQAVLSAVLAHLELT